MGHGDRSHQLSLSLYENGREGPRSLEEAARLWGQLGEGWVASQADVIPRWSSDAGFRVTLGSRLRTRIPDGGT